MKKISIVQWYVLFRISVTAMFLFCVVSVVHAGTTTTFNATTGVLTVGSDLVSLTTEAVDSILERDGYNIDNHSLRMLDLAQAKHLESIDHHAFTNCKALERINFNGPIALSSIGISAFAYCSALKKVELGEYCSITTIEDYAFKDCILMDSLTLPPSITAIRKYAFNNCSALKSITCLSSSQPSIYSYAFSGASSGRYLYCPNASRGFNAGSWSAETLKYGLVLTYTFDDATGVLKIAGNDYVVETSRVNSAIGRSSYNTVNNTLLTLDLSEAKAIQKIETNAFRNCRGLKHISIGKSKSLERVEDYAFYYCSSLEDLDFSQCTALTTIEGSAFSQCSSLKNLDLSQCTALTTIEGSAFSKCTNLEYVHLPSRLSSIGANCFYNSYRLLSYQIDSETPPTIESISNYTRIVYVPQGAKALYSEATYWKDYAIIEGNNPVTVEVEVKSAGELGKEILKQVEYLNEVNVLTVKGALNSDDFFQLTSRMPNLISLDLTEALCTSLPSSFMRDRSKLAEIKLPQTLSSIGSYAFGGCNGLTSLEIPEGVTTLNTQAFYDCRSLKRIVLPSTLHTLGSYSFEDCYSLDSIVIPQGIKTINSYTFKNCDRLTSIELPKGLTAIESSAFESCDALKQITFPETLASLYPNSFGSCYGLTEVLLPASLDYYNQPFNYSTNIRTITALSSVPPTGCTDVLYGVDKSIVTLYVPLWSVNDYKLSVAWGVVGSILPCESEIDHIRVNGALTIAPAKRPKNKPDVTVTTAGKLKVEGDELFSIGRYTQHFEMKYNYNGEDQSNYSSQYSESAHMRADSVSLILSDEGSYKKWIFFSPPFDLSVESLVITPADAKYVIRTYNGAGRAKNGGDNWVQLTPDSILHANQGYIIQFNKDVSSVQLKALNNGAKNRIFSSKPLAKELNEYTSEFAHNRSWNFVGNPYTCFYDIKYLDYTAPITVWHGNGYTALSPLDDNYVLKPMQAFFIQKPLDVDSITFPTRGRQHTTEITPRYSENQLQSEVITERTLYNLTLKGESYSDRSRIVINPCASMRYESKYDAAKFMSIEKSVPQLFSVTDNGYLAINERPLSDGVVQLGFYIGESGSYTIAIKESPAMEQVVLIDKLLNKQVDITTNSYSFTSEVGTFTQRFELRVGGGAAKLELADSPRNQVTVVGGEILVKTQSNRRIVIFSITGEQIATAIATDSSARFNVIPGIYIVQIENEVYKVSVIN